MYAEQRQQSLIRGTALGGGANYSEPKIATEAVISHTEIDGELNNIRQNIERLLGAVGFLQDRLYPVLAGELNGVNGTAAPQPVMNSPLGQSMRVENERLYDLANRIDAIRARIQL